MPIVLRVLDAIACALIIFLAARCHLFQDTDTFGYFLIFAAIVCVVHLAFRAFKG